MGPETLMDQSLAELGFRIDKQFAASRELIPDENDNSVVKRTELLNEAQRFELWAVNLGLYHGGHSSLDYRVRDSPPLFKYAHGLLRDLDASLTQCEC